MKSLLDIHTVLATPADMEDVYEEPELACEKLNEMLHMVYARVDESIEVGQLEQMLQQVWENWHQDPHLCDLDVDEMLDWVEYLVLSCDNQESDQDA